MAIIISIHSNYHVDTGFFDSSKRFFLVWAMISAILVFLPMHSGTYAKIFSMRPTATLRAGWRHREIERENNQPSHNDVPMETGLAGLCWPPCKSASSSDVSFVSGAVGGAEPFSSFALLACISCSTAISLATKLT